MGGGTSKQQLILADFINAIRSGDYKEMIKIHGQNPKLGLINMKEKETGKTPAIYAASRGQVKELKWLMENGADINIKDNDGVAAMDQAGGWGDEAEKVMELLSAGGGKRTMEIFTVEDVAKHKREEDCWIIIDDYVFDVSQYMDKHPGGSTIIAKLGGQDASKDFNKPGRHSSAATAKMKSMRFGHIGPVPESEK